MFVGIGLVACGGSDNEAEPPPVVFLSATPRSTLTPTFPPPRPTTVGSPTATTCVGNQAWGETYEVQAGDSLLRIAILAGTTLDEMRRGNCLTGTDFVFIGQVLRVPNTFSLNVANDPTSVNNIITFIISDGQYRALWSVTSDGRFPNALTPEDMVVWGAPSRSPDRARVAFRALSPFQTLENRDEVSSDFPTDVYVVNLDGSELRVLVDQSPLDMIYRSDPVWSPDGTQLAFTELRGTSGSLVVIDRDGQNRQVVLADRLSPSVGTTPPAPAWSPDGEQLAIIRWRDDGTAQLLLTGTTARSGIQQVLIDEFLFVGGGPYWVPFNGFNGRPAVAIQQFDAFTGQSWLVANPTTQEVARRNGGLWLTDPTLTWRVSIRNGTTVLLQNDIALETFNNQAALASISFAPDVAGLVRVEDAGLQYFGLEEPVRIILYEGNIQHPVWSEPLWLVLP